VFSRFAPKTNFAFHNHRTHVTLHEERAAGLALLPVFATIGFYLLPANWQSQPAVQFAPQLIAYLALGLWAIHNVDRLPRLGLESNNIRAGLGWGTIAGTSLGCMNTMIILFAIPAFGGNSDFLLNTPHARIPPWIMVPWFILVIAMAVELNFRGFLLGRLLRLFAGKPNTPNTFQNEFIGTRGAVILPLGISALTFSFDPFMVATFRHLHWIALWDGLIWGWMRIRMNNLYAVIIAHAIEVIILYLTIRATLS
jgi:membrane protease YdiL (CAAX protease family)